MGAIHLERDDWTICANTHNWLSAKREGEPDSYFGVPLSSVIGSSKSEDGFEFSFEQIEESEPLIWRWFDSIPRG